MKKLLISFSGGETSAYMTWWILNNWAKKYEEIKVLFANTGQENEETLSFVKKCDDHFGFKTIWVEADVQHGVRKSAKAKVVSYETASRNGFPFEEMIKKYGIPNQKFKHCTRVLKLEPIYSYLDSIGWEKEDFDVAIGIRADEIDRISSTADINNIIYPLVAPLNMTKPKINSWWAEQPFRLNLKGYQGNCKWCWKKSKRKLFTILDETPEYFDFPESMENKYGKIGAEFKRHADTLPDNYNRVFFRKNMSTQELKDLFQKEKDFFIRADDDAMVFDPEYDIGAGCEESCEVFSDEDMRGVNP